MSLFRKDTLDKAGSPEQLTDSIRIIDKGTVFAFVGIIVIALTIGFWMIFGTIPNTITVKGIIFPQHGVVEIFPRHEGRLTTLLVSVGSEVKAGQIIGFMPNEEIAEEIAVLKNTPGYSEDAIQMLFAKYEEYSVITAPVSGVVLLCGVSAGEYVSKSEPIAIITREVRYANNQQVICYLDVSTAKLIKLGQKVQITPDYVSREEYGYMLGSVVSIGQYPATSDNIKQTLGNEQYAASLLPNSGDAPIEVRLELSTDIDSKNGIKCSNKRGETLDIQTGTYCDIQIITSERKPYQLFLY